MPFSGQKTRADPFHSFTFPIGVFATCTTQLGTELDSAFFKVLGTILSCAVVAVWIGVVLMTATQAWSGEL